MRICKLKNSFLYFSVLILCCLFTIIPKVNAHDTELTTKEAEAANESRYKGMSAMSQIPGAINLGLTGKHVGATASRHLNHQMSRRIAVNGTYTRSGKNHFGASATEDVRLISTESDSIVAGARCTPSQQHRVYDVTAINVDITLNQYGDFHPGYMYVLNQNIDKVRAEEEENEEGRAEKTDPGGVSNGLSGDAIQPLAIRVNQGECLVINLTNAVEDENVSLHLHGSSLLVSATGQPASGVNADTTLEPEQSRSFEWNVPMDQQEGVHQFHSLIRDQAAIGLFGSLTVEPYGSRHLDPYTGEELSSGWLAMIEDPSGPDFREFVVVYHEVGDDEFRPLDAAEEMILQRDDVAHNYRSASKALNYRSEPFSNSMRIERDMFGVMDESLAYSAYHNGDPSTPIPRSYMGDPAKWRLVHGGSEVFHSHHLHGGAIRWRRQASLTRDLVLGGKDNFALATDVPIKFPPIQVASDRVDVQALGPAETHDLVIECGTGGCQRTAGDFLYHCHVVHHYVAGMWAFWRSYNTLQTEGVQTDVMPALAELPDRKGKTKAAVFSSELVGKRMSWFGKYLNIVGENTAPAGDEPTNVKGFFDKLFGDDQAPTKSEPRDTFGIEEWVSMQLPPKGKQGKADNWKDQILAYDASVYDWEMQGNDAMAEPETMVDWAKYKPEWMGYKAGQRTKFLFNPDTGKLAYPHLRPHFGKRPPFSPGKNGAPFLSPIHHTKSGRVSANVPKPGENGPWSLCPREANAPEQIKHYNVHAIETPITLTKTKGNLPPIVDPHGQLFVLHEEEAGIRANDDLKIPLVLRMNVGDCTDVILSNEIPDNEENLYSSKVNMHIHFVQFDVQASDGVITGFNYEQSVRPFNIIQDQHADKGFATPLNTTIDADAERGDTRISVAKGDLYQAGVLIGVGLDAVGRVEIRQISSVNGNTLNLTEPLEHDHFSGEFVSTEFVRYRWYADVDFGITYWHDHVYGLTSWGHGLFGSTIIEPKGSTYHDPVTGKPVRSGNVVDIHTNEAVSATVTGSFREFVMQIQDSNPRTETQVISGTVVNEKPQDDRKPNHINALGSYDSWSLPVNVFEYLNGGDRTSGGSMGMRVEPLHRRMHVKDDPSQLFSSQVHGDPDTPMISAYLGDPIVLRTLVEAANETHTIHVQGHYFPLERFAARARPKNSVHIAIAERYDLVIPAAGGPQQQAGDYLWRSGRLSHLGEGMWGLIRVLDEPIAGLQVLPNREEIAKSAASICPANAPQKHFNVSAIDYAMDLNPKAPDMIAAESGTNRNIIAVNKNGKVFVLDGQVSAVQAGKMRPHPMTLRVNIGDCITVTLNNQLKAGRVSFHADMLAYNPHDSMGANIGNNRGGDQTIGPGSKRTYTFYAHPEYGETAALVLDYGDITHHWRDGLYGAIVIGPRGSKYHDPHSGADISLGNSWQANVLVDNTIYENRGRSNYRDAALFFQDEDNLIGTPFMPYVADTAGLSAVNYRIEPLQWRAEAYDCSMEEGFGFACPGAGDPATPVLTVHAGDTVRINVIGAHNEQNTTFSLQGHQWPLEPLMAGSEMLETEQFGATETIQVNVTAGGPYGLPGDYMWLSHRLTFAESGQWGLMRVLPKRSKKLPRLQRADFVPEKVKAKSMSRLQANRKTIKKSDGMRTKPVKLTKVKALDKLAVLN